MIAIATSLLLRYTAIPSPSAESGATVAGTHHGSVNRAKRVNRPSSGTGRETGVTRGQKS